MHPRKRLSIKSATVAGIAASALLGLAGLTLNPAPAKAVVYCQYVGYPPVALPGQASCSGLVRWRALRSVITPVATEMVASIALGRGGKALVCGSTSEKEAVTASSRRRLFYCPVRRTGDRDVAASRHEPHLVCHF